MDTTLSILLAISLIGLAIVLSFYAGFAIGLHRNPAAKIPPEDTAYKKGYCQGFYDGLSWHLGIETNDKPTQPANQSHAHA